MADFKFRKVPWVVITGKTNSTVGMLWDAVPNALSYNIYRNGVFRTNRPATVYPGQEVWTDTGLLSNTAYTYAASAVMTKGEGTIGKAASVTTDPAPGDTTPPVWASTPAVTATALSAYSVQIDCVVATDNVGVTRYKFERSLDGLTGWVTVQDNSTSRTCVDSGRSPSTQYFYRVSALDAASNQSAYAYDDVVTSAAATATGFDYYISPTGSSSNPGTQSQPWKIMDLNDPAKRLLYKGKRVGLLDGVYNLFDDCVAIGGVYWSSNLIYVEGGTAQSPTIIEAVNPRKAIITNMSPQGLYPDKQMFPQNDISGGMIGASEVSNTASGSFVHFKGLHFRDIFGGAIKCGWQLDSGHSRLNKTDGIVIENCWFKNTHIFGAPAGGNQAAVSFNHTKNPIIRNCLFEENYGISLTENGHNSAVLMWDVHDALIEYNTVRKCCAAFDWKGPQNSLSISTNEGRIVRYNYVEGDPTRYSSGIGFDDEGIDGKETHIYGNVIQANGGIGRIVSYNLRCVVRIYNNTFVHYGEMPYGGGGTHLRFYNGDDKLHYYNNINYRDTNIAETAELNCSDAVWATLDRNCYYVTSGFRVRVVTPGTEYGTIADYRTFNEWRTHAQLTLAGAEANSITSDPQFEGLGYGASKYQLAAGSPCMTAGAGGTQIGAWGAGGSRIGCDFVYDYYISPTGSDANTGTESSPWAATALQTKGSTIARKRIGFLDGTYSIAVGYTDGGSGDVGIRIPSTSSGTASARTYIGAVNERAAVLQAAAPYSTVIRSEADYTDFWGFSTNKGFSIRGHYSTVQNCHFANLYQTALSGDNFGAISCKLSNEPKTIGVTIRNCKFENIFNLPSNGQSGNCCGVYLNSAENWTIEDCTFNNCRQFVLLKYDNISLTVRRNHGYNMIEFCKDFGAESGVTTRHVFENNICALGGSGSAPYQYGASQVLSDMDLKNNTFVVNGGNGGAQRIYQENGSAAASWNIKNNIIKANANYTGGGTVWIWGGQAGSAGYAGIVSECDYNLYSGTLVYAAVDGDFYAPTSTYTLAQWRALGFDTHTLNQTPVFQGADNSDPDSFKLAGGSPGIGTGEGGVDMGAWGGSAPPATIGCNF